MADERRYLEIVVEPIRVCANYRPQMGHGREGGFDLVQFQTLYKKDAFYSWFGLDNPLMYAAHKAAGGMTSIYRQIGIGCERLFRKVLMDSLGLSASDVEWSYTVKRADGRSRGLSLDGRIPWNKIPDEATRERIIHWAMEASKVLGLEDSIAGGLKGAVFEVRQGYKSKDSKRQNADIANAATAYTQAYLPCVVVLSTQIDQDIQHRYFVEKWLVLTGISQRYSPLNCTYAFMRDVVGYDLAAFFEKNSKTLRDEVDRVLRKLLSTEP